MTPEDVQRLGALDPVNVSIDEDGPCFSLEKPEDGPKILQVIKQLQISDKDIGLDDDGLFGLRPTDRDRGMQLFRGGNVVSETVKVTSGTLRSDRTPVWIISGDVVASQRGNNTREHTNTHVHTCTHTHTQSLTNRSSLSHDSCF